LEPTEICLSKNSASREIDSLEEFQEVRIAIRLKMQVFCLDQVFWHCQESARANNRFDAPSVIVADRALLHVPTPLLQEENTRRRLPIALADRTDPKVGRIVNGRRIHWIGTPRTLLHSCGPRLRKEWGRRTILRTALSQGSEILRSAVVTTLLCEMEDEKVSSRV
jgi:hypothetical protein